MKPAPTSAPPPSPEARIAAQDWLSSVTTEDDETSLARAFERWNAALAAQPPAPVPCCENGNFGDGHECLKQEARLFDQNIESNLDSFDAAMATRAPPQSACHLIGGNDDLFCVTHKADAPDGVCEGTPPQPGDAERRERAKRGQNWLYAALEMIGDGEHTDHDIAKIIVENETDLLALIEQLDAAQSALAASRRQYGDCVDEFARAKTSWLAELAASQAEVARLKEAEQFWSPTEREMQFLDALLRCEATLSPSKPFDHEIASDRSENLRRVRMALATLNTPDARLRSPAATFGEPAPRNFDKERPGPDWNISDETQRELETMERQHREAVANLRSPAALPDDIDPVHEYMTDMGSPAATVRYPDAKTAAALAYFSDPKYASKEGSPAATGEDRGEVERQKQIARVAKLRMRDDDNAPPRNLVEEITAAFPVDDWTDILASALKITEPTAKNAIGRVIASAHAAFTAEEVAAARAQGVREGLERARSLVVSHWTFGDVTSAIDRALAAPETREDKL